MLINAYLDGLTAAPAVRQEPFYGHFVGNCPQNTHLEFLRAAVGGEFTDVNWLQSCGALQ